MEQGLSDLTGRIGLVTGAGEGIGRAIALTLAKAGARIAVTDVDVQKAERVAREVEAAGGHAMTAELDVTDRSSIEAALSAVVGAWQRIDLWCSNAGVSSMNRFVDLTEADWDHNLDVNAKGVFLCGQAAARQMLTQERRADDGLRGKIINMASVAGKTGKVAFLSHYIASKYAVVGLTQAMATELGPEGIVVNAVCPGYVRTAMQEREIAWEASLRGIGPDAVKQLYLDDTPLGRLETPEDVAGVVGFLASRPADFLTGIAITVAGGAWMQ
jgi:meso-butanediol dehydrogenase / (S,S)-butanediol dehydrogenase / diacetyl reductase